MKEKKLLRRKFLRLCVSVPVLLSTNMSLPALANKAKPRTFKNKISLNAYSFNEALSKGLMSINDLLEYAASTGFDAVDLTAYYFPGYPQVPADEVINEVKRKAFRFGLEISGTGVRNDFTEPDENKRRVHITLVKNWIVAASKLGAPVIRIFSGTQNPAGFSREEILTWMIADIKDCVAFGKQHGVMVAIQNHHDFIKTAAQTKEIIERVNDSWFSLILDIGSYRGPDPYNEIKEMIPFACSWQLKENMYVNAVEQKTDLRRIWKMIKEAGYRGYLPIETLGPGDAKLKVAEYLTQVKKTMQS